MRPAVRPILTVAVNGELDVIAARQRARELAALCGFGALDQARIATAVSELARNIINYAIAGTVRYSVSQEARGQALDIDVADNGPGIHKLDVILGGNYRSTTGMGLGILAARRLMDRCDIVTAAGQGTRITLGKMLPAKTAPMTPAAIALLVSQLTVLPDNMALSESRQQNRDLGDALAALQLRQDDLIALTARLEETNARVEALNVQLDEKAQALQGADRRKDEFVAILSHELRGPLSAVGMAAQLLAASPFTAEYTNKMSQVITRQVDHMHHLVEDLLDVSRVSRGLVTIARVPVDLRGVVRDSVEQVAAQAQQKRHEIVMTLPPTACVIEGDSTRLVQVATNLLGNAIRYTPDGGKIAIVLAAGAGVVSLRVTDNCIGLATELMPHLFDLYVQAERVTARDGGGLGLGLALVKSLVEAHHG
ncbi:MAG: ATP-binding protein [Telluria sp.]